MNKQDMSWMNNFQDESGETDWLLSEPPFEDEEGDNLPDPYLDPLDTNYEANSPSFHANSNFNDQGYDLDIIEDWVKQAHEGQVRKYTNDPYYTHVFRVADMVMEYTNDVHMYIAALMHDVLEDTEMGVMHIVNVLQLAGVDEEGIAYIGQMVVDLTDVFTKEDFPFYNRADRKLKEAKRLGMVSPSSQTIKYCDLIDNTSSIVKYDVGFARVYLKEKREILDRMDKGDSVLYNIARNLLEEKESMLE